MRRTLIIILILVVCFVSTRRTSLDAYSRALQPKAGSLSWDVRPQPLGAPSDANSSGPRLSTSARGVLLSWVERDGSSRSLKFPEKRSAGWGQVTTVASGADLMDSAADPPIVMRRPDGAIIASWQVSTDKKLEGSDLYLTY
jgi:hypothetical protein